jgi:hypothetical protein
MQLLRGVYGALRTGDINSCMYMQLVISTAACTFSSLYMYSLTGCWSAPTAWVALACLFGFMLACSIRYVLPFNCSWLLS